MKVSARLVSAYVMGNNEYNWSGLINGYCEYLEHAHQFVSVNMAVSSCQVVLFWFLVSGMAIIL